MLFLFRSALIGILFTSTVYHDLAAEVGIISPEQALELIQAEDEKDRPIVLDTRGGYKDYFRGHLPTAHHINFDTLRGTDQGVPVQYLPDELTRALLIRAGIDKARTHVVYATGAELPNDEVLSASMVAYVLEKFGVEQILIVDGGLAAWQTAGLPTTQEYFGNALGNLPAQADPSIGIALDELWKIKDEPNTVIVDARPLNEYLGEDDVWLRKGHIPGAISFHWAKLMSKSNTHDFLPLAEVQSQLTESGLTPDKNIVVYCGTSREGSLLRFCLKHLANYPHVRLYEGSWKEYASMKQYPAERQPQRPR